jgi:polyisoprenoid-binding protein YceI
MSSLAVQTLPATGLWNIDSAHSTARFSVRHHAVATFRGGFSAITGHYDAETGSLVGEVRVDRAELQGLDRLKNHFLTPDFFDAERNPTLSFESNAVRVEGDALTVDGELTLRGIRRPVIARGTVQGPAVVRHQDGHVSERLGIDLTASIDRREYGVQFNSEIAEGVLNLGWDVTIEVALELVGASGDR